jgi:GNAT superfamily N-acetyltransferase
VEVHHAANHAKFGPRAQRTTLADVLAVPGRRHEQWQCFAGYAGDKLVGAGAAITTRDNPHVGTMWLSVHPDHQGRGLGGALLAEIERDLRERGCTELLVHATETSDGGGASPHFAARYGFRYAVDASAFGAFLHQGQICMSARRLLVDRRVADAFVDRLAAKTAG